MEAISRADAKNLRRESVGRKAQPSLVFEFSSCIEARQNVIVDSPADSENVIGQIGDRPEFRISEHRRVVEYPTSIHDLRVWRETPVV